MWSATANIQSNAAVDGLGKIWPSKQWAYIIMQLYSRASNAHGIVTKAVGNKSCRVVTLAPCFRVCQSVTLLRVSGCVGA